MCATYLLGNHVYRILNPGVGNDGEHRSIDDANAFHAVHPEARVHNSIGAVLAQPTSSTRV